MAGSVQGEGWVLPGCTGTIPTYTGVNIGQITPARKDRIGQGE
jgi:hypothetical protein